MRRVWLGFSVSLLWLWGLSGWSSAGTVTGTVITKVVEKPKPPPRYYLGPRRSGRGPEVQAEGGPADVVVSLEGPGVDQPITPPAARAQMIQQGEAFIPHVLPVAVGTTVEFPNHDDFYHNVFSVIAGERFDLGRYPKGQSARQTFIKPAVVVVRCEIHAGMKAFIVVLKNPYFTVPDRDGRFMISNVPAGTYTIKAWHPTQPTQSRSLTVPESGEVKVEFGF